MKRALLILLSSGAFLFLHGIGLAFATVYDIQCKHHDGITELIYVDTETGSVSSQYLHQVSDIMSQNYKFVSDTSGSLVLYASPLVGGNAHVKVDLRSGEMFRNGELLKLGYAHMGQCRNK
jgi:hypothetical protein